MSIARALKADEKPETYIKTKSANFKVILKNINL